MYCTLTNQSTLEKWGFKYKSKTADLTWHSCCVPRKHISDLYSVIHVIREAFLMNSQVNELLQILIKQQALCLSSINPLRCLSHTVIIFISATGVMMCVKIYLGSGAVTQQEPLSFLYILVHLILLLQNGHAHIHLYTHTHTHLHIQVYLL